MRVCGCTSVRRQIIQEAERRRRGQDFNSLTGEGTGTYASLLPFDHIMKILGDLLYLSEWIRKRRYY
jgi:hypothetical protein